MTNATDTDKLKKFFNLNDDSMNYRQIMRTDDALLNDMQLSIKYRTCIECKEKFVKDDQVCTSMNGHSCRIHIGCMNK